MIYLFNDGSVTYDESILTEDEKTQAWAVESLPEPEEREGYYATLKFDVDKKEIWYEYESIPKSPEQEIQDLKNRLDATEQALLQIMMEGMM